jgi:hypothetical protein
VEGGAHGWKRACMGKGRARTGVEGTRTAYRGEACMAGRERKRVK